MRQTLSLALFAGLVATPLLALPPLHQDRTVRGGFYTIGLADEIRKNCPDISARLIRAYVYLKSLERYALDAGYSRADIEALEDNDAAKDKLRAQARAALARRGASPETPEGYCRVGREEIAGDTPVGRLLKEN